jgi:hypothetical protein
MNKRMYVSVNIPIINDADQMEIVKTFNDEQLWYVGAIAKAFERLEEENEEWKLTFDTFSKRPYAHRYLEEKKAELENKNIIGLDSEMIYKDYYNYKSKVDNAIKKVNEIIKSNISALSNPENTIISKHELLKLNVKDCKELLKILEEKYD